MRTAPGAPADASAARGPTAPLRRPSPRQEDDHMPTRRPLKDRKIAALAADGFEKVELVSPLRALKRAGAQVDVVSLRRGRIRGMNLHLPAGPDRRGRRVKIGRAHV